MKVEQRTEEEQVSHVGIPGWGADLREKDRPGVPKEAEPHRLPHAHWEEPERQAPSVEVLKRADRKDLTPVFGTAEPPRGVSGALRRAAYHIPDHLVRHWAILMLADRVDVMEGRVLRVLRRVMPARQRR